MTDEVAYEEMTVADLKVELESRGLAVSGTKDELVERLETDDFANEPDPAASEPEQTPEEEATPSEPEPTIRPPEVPLSAMDPEYRDAGREGWAQAAANATAAEEESKANMEEEGA